MSIMSTASLLRWLRSGFRNRRGKRRASSVSGSAVAARRRNLPRLELLEARIDLATLQVNSMSASLVGKGLKFSDLRRGAMVGLPDAIDIANNTGGSNEIVMEPRLYKLDKIDNYWYGPNGLPAV